MTVSTTLRKVFKSPARCLIASLRKSRQLWKEKYRTCCHQRAELQKECDRSKDEIRRLSRELRQVRANNQVLTQRLQECSPQQRWANVKGHPYSAAMIATSCQLAGIVGFRAAPRVLKLFSDTFALNLKIPTRDAIRNWTCRAGVALLETDKADDWIWMIDHSVQLGKMHVLVVLGIRLSELPYRQDCCSRTLRREDLHVLAVLPSQSKSKEQVIADLEPVAQQLGTPLAVLCDGASELKAAIESLQTRQNTDQTPSDESSSDGPVHLVDVKHKIASGLKKLLTGDEVFDEFSKRTSRCAALIRQTELDHLMPPTRKDKCRFMNIHREIRWAAMALSQLDRLADCSEPSSVRLREKLGWLVEFRESIKHWRGWCDLIGSTLSFTNQYGVYRGGSIELRRRLQACGVDRVACAPVWEIVVNAYSDNETKLSGMPSWVRCLPGSTELLESAFGIYKAMQRHHNRGTFTTLLAALPTVFARFSEKSIREQFSRVSNQDLKSWLQKHHLLDSTQSRRARAYAAA